VVLDEDAETMIEAIREQVRSIPTQPLPRVGEWIGQIGQIIVVIVSMPPFAVGWMFGFAVRTLMWMVAAVVAGYKAGRGS
jgi:hypothetical protein